MAKKVAPRKETTTKNTVHPSLPAAPQLAVPPFFQNSRLNGWLVFLLAVVMFANTLGHEFTLDDSLIIYKNEYTTQGLAGIPDIFSHDVALAGKTGEGSNEIVAGGRYRPMSVAVFAVIFQFFGANPWAFHLFSVLAFALTCWVLYRVLRSVFGVEGWAALLVWLATVLFVVHPIHTEVVNNVKSADEILALLFSLLALNFSLKLFRTDGLKWAVATFAAYLTACFSKENAAMFAAIIPLTLWMDARRRQSVDPNFQKNAQSNFKSKIFKTSAVAWAALAIFLVVRGSILGWSLGEPKMDLINNAFIKLGDGKWVAFTGAEKFATIFYCLGKYLWLLVFPHPLSHDYYPRAVEMQTFSSPVVLFSLVFHIFLVVFGIVGFLRGRMSAVRWGIAFYLITLFIASNIPVSIGTNMAERFAFMPSVGACVALAGLILGLVFWRPAAMKFVLAGFGVVCLLFAGKTFSRNSDYANNKKLLLTDVKVVPNSAKIRYGLGGIFLKEALAETHELKRLALTNDAIAHLDRAIEIHPTYAEAFFTRGSAYFVAKKFQAAIANFERSLFFVPGRPEVINNYALALLEAGKEILSKKQSTQQALQYLNQSNELVPNNSETMMAIGVAQIQLGQVAEAVQTLNKILILDPNNEQVRRILAEISK